MIFRIKREKPSSTEVDNIFIRDCMPHAPELAVKAYLYGLMLASAGDTETDLASALGQDEDDVRAAFCYLEAQGLVEVIDGGRKEEGPGFTVIYKKPELLRVSTGSDSARYASLVAELSKALGTRTLTGAELSRIYDWVELYGFTQDAAVLIVKRCLSVKGPRTSVAYMDKAAKAIAAEGRFTSQAVREYFEEEELLRSGAAAVLKRWHRKRPPTEDEIALYEKWTKAWGFGEEALDLALSKMTSAENPSFAYLDGILSELQRSGSTDPGKLRELSRQDDAAAELARLAFSRAGLKRSPDREAREQFREWHFSWCMDAELILFAADIAGKKPRPYASMKELLALWHSEGVDSVVKAKESLVASGASEKASAKKNRSMNYMQGRKYSEGELKKLGITLGEEFYEDDGQ